MGIKQRNMHKTTGKRIFQDIIINMSQRKRQNVIRIQIKIKEKNIAISIIITELIGNNQLKKI